MTPGEDADRFGTQRLVKTPTGVDYIPIRAITVYQPWAYMLVYLPAPYRKTIENRPPGFSNLKFRGPVWIHASGKLSRPQYDTAIAAARDLGVPMSSLPPWERVATGTWPGFERGAIVGRVTITQRLAPTETPTNPWHLPRSHGFVTEGPIGCHAVPCRGQLGFWRIADETARILGGQL